MIIKFNNAMKCIHLLRGLVKKIRKMLLFFHRVHTFPDTGYKLYRGTDCPLDSASVNFLSRDKLTV